MNIFFFGTLLSALLVLARPTAADDEFVFEDGVFGLSVDGLVKTKTAADLSLEAYEGNEGDFTIFVDEPDRVLLSKQGDVCYVAYRGTVFWRIVDWMQNFSFGNRSVCNGDTCCTVVTGMYDGYNRSYRDTLEASIRECVASCETENCELVLTGHSQGGSIASVAALYLADLNPLLITFGQPPTIDKPCELINEDRYLRFENSREGWWGRTYEPVPYLPYDANHMGHQILLAEYGRAAYLGKGHVTFGPWDVANLFSTHRLSTGNGYFPRLASLMDKAKSSNNEVFFLGGFDDGARCTKDIECMGSCRRRYCRGARRMLLRGA